MRVDDHRKLMIVVLDEGSLEAVQVPGLYGYPHEAGTDPSFLSPRGASSLAEITLMADVLPFNQPLIVLGRRKKKDEERKKIKAPAAFFLFPALEGRREDEEATFLFLPLLAAEPRKGEERGHELERERASMMP